MKHPKGMKRGIRPMKRACGARGENAGGLTRVSSLPPPYENAATLGILHCSLFFPSVNFSRILRSGVAFFPKVYYNSKKPIFTKEIAMNDLDSFVESKGSKEVALLGCGVSNTPLIPFFLSRGYRVTLRDASPRSLLPQGVRDIANEGLIIKTGENWLQDLTEPLILRSPGMRPDRFPALTEAKRRGSTVTTELGLFLAVSPIRVLGVTGSDGKSTTASLTAAILRESGHRVFLGGNIGEPLLPRLDEMSSGDLAVAEISSFQLYDTLSPPSAAAVTGITENHLDWHADFSEYVNAKRNILLSRGVRVLSADRPLPDGFEEDGVTAYFSTEKNKKDLFSRYENATLAYLDGGFVCIRENGSEKRLFPVSDFALPADYDRKNLFAAILLSLPFATENGIHTAAKTAKALPHRMEKVASVGGVTYYDSSIDSSPARTAASLSALPFSPIVIMGGKNKGLSYEALPDLLAKRAKAVILTGENATDQQNALNQSRAFRESGVGLFLEDSLSSAVFRAAKLAKAGDAVVLSPAATSFDRYKNFAARGEDFQKAVLSLTE